MRRPRGPGGRFLTAEEIAAQRTGSAEASAAGNDEDEEDHPQDLHPHISPQSTSHPSVIQKHHDGYGNVHEPTVRSASEMNLSNVSYESLSHSSNPSPTLPQPAVHKPHPPLFR
jgi:hypothetical protein